MAEKSNEVPPTAAVKSENDASLSVGDNSAYTPVPSSSEVPPEPAGPPEPADEQNYEVMRPVKLCRGAEPSATGNSPPEKYLTLLRTNSEGEYVTPNPIPSRSKAAIQAPLESSNPPKKKLALFTKDAFTKDAFNEKLPMVVFITLMVTAVVAMLGLLLAVIALALSGSRTEGGSSRQTIDEMQADIYYNSERIQQLEQMLMENQQSLISSNLTLGGATLFQNCRTGITHTCTVEAGQMPIQNQSFAQCLTGAIDINQPGNYTLNVNCLVFEVRQEPNPILATLEIVDSLHACRCVVPLLNGNSAVTEPVTCSMQITRCSIPTNITTTVV